MAVNPLPPQAFTKDILQKAYAWLLTQNASIKEMASTQELLVSLYMKAQRHGDASLETPSIQNFKQELKTLANLMGDLQTPTPPPASSHAATPTTSPGGGHLPPSSASFQGASAYQNLPNFASSQPASTSAMGALELDPVSLNALAETKSVLNLSSDAEALRAVIALGYKQLKKI